MEVVHLRDEVGLRALALGVDVGGRVEVQNGIRSVAEGRALVCRGHVAGAPVLGAAGDFAAVGEHDEPGQVAVLAAEAVHGPRPEARPPREHRPRVHLADAADVVEPIRPAGAEQGEVVGTLGHVRQPVAEVEAGLSVLGELAFGGEQVVASGAHRREHFAEAGGQRLAVLPREFGLRVGEIDVTRPAFHEQENDRLGLRGEVRFLRHVVALCECGERERAEASAGLSEELASGLEQRNVCVHSLLPDNINSQEPDCRLATCLRFPKSSQSYLPPSRSSTSFARNSPQLVAKTRSGPTS